MSLLQTLQVIACFAFLLFVFFFQDIPYSMFWFVFLLILNVCLFVLRKRKQTKSRRS